MHHLSGCFHSPSFHRHCRMFALKYWFAVYACGIHSLWTFLCIFKEMNSMHFTRGQIVWSSSSMDVMDSSIENTLTLFHCCTCKLDVSSPLMILEGNGESLRSFSLRSWYTQTCFWFCFFSSLRWWGTKFVAVCCMFRFCARMLLNVPDEIYNSLASSGIVMRLFLGQAF
jgi:hypothetical protein